MAAGVASVVMMMGVAGLIDAEAPKAPAVRGPHKKGDAGEIQTETLPISAMETSVPLAALSLEGLDFKMQVPTHQSLADERSSVHHESRAQKSLAAGTIRI
jgi:hypothetical protein